MNTEQLEKEIKDFVNAIFIRGEKDAIEYASSFIQTKQREAFEAGREGEILTHWEHDGLEPYAQYHTNVWEYKDFDSYLSSVKC